MIVPIICAFVNQNENECMRMSGELLSKIEWVNNFIITSILLKYIGCCVQCTFSLFIRSLSILYTKAQRTDNPFIHLINLCTFQNQQKPFSNMFSHDSIISSFIIRILHKCKGNRNRNCIKNSKLKYSR